MILKKSILVVDDELGPRESIRMILNKKYEVHTAASGQEALECLKNNKFDLITLDLRMPGLSGFEVLREIRKNHANMEVIVVTGYASPQNSEEVADYGVDEFITKPFDAPAIIGSVNRSLERRRVKNFMQYNSLVVRA
jgi:putative two-component system response regulator